MSFNKYLNDNLKNFINISNLIKLDFKSVYLENATSDESIKCLSILLGREKEKSLDMIGEYNDLIELINKFNIDINGFYYKVTDICMKCFYYYNGFIIEIYELENIEELFKYLREIEKEFDSYFFNGEELSPFLFNYIADNYKIPVLNFLYDYIKPYDRCKIVKEFFKHNDYTSSYMPLNMLIEAYNDTLESFNDEYITVYRGEGSKSNTYESAYSWSTNIDVAKFFATRAFHNETNKEDMKVYKAIVPKEYIVGIIDDEEEEVIINPKVFSDNIIEVEEVTFDKSKAHVLIHRPKSKNTENKIKVENLDEEDSTITIAPSLLKLIGK